MSSAKNKWEIIRPPLQRENPWIFPSFTTFWISPFNPSEHKRNKYGDKGSPCLKPLDGKIWPLGSPFTNIEKETKLNTLINPSYPFFMKAPPLYNFHKKNPDVQQNLLFNYCNLLFLVFLCKKRYFRFRWFISLFLGAFNAF